MAAGLGEPVDSRRYGPVPVELLVGRAWFRYAPLADRRIARPAPTLAAEYRARPSPSIRARREPPDGASRQCSVAGERPN